MIKWKNRFSQTANWLWILKNKINILKRIIKGLNIKINRLKLNIKKLNQKAINFKGNNSIRLEANKKKKIP